MSVIEQKLRTKITVEGVENAKRQLGSVEKSIGAMAKTVALAAAAWKGLQKVISIANDAMRDFERSQQAMRQISGVLESTGKSAMFTAQELSKLAGELQAVSNFGDEDILQGVTMGLLRFDGISKDVFIRAQNLAVDLGESMGGLENATRTLGISLADPTLGITRLRRAGVMFTKTQEEMIINFVETGRQAEAQEMMLEALESKYGGLAMASISAATQLRNSWSDMLEAMGKSLGFVDGIRKGLAVMFSDIASHVDTTSKSAQIEMLELQLAWAETTVEVANNTVQIMETIGKYSMSVVNTIGTIIKFASAALNLIGDIGHGVIAYNKDLMEMGLEDFTGTMKHIGNIWEDWDDKFRDAGRSREADINRQIERLRKLTSEQIKALDLGTLVMPGLDAEEMKESLKVAEDLIGRELRIWADYYDAIDKYSKDWLDAQLGIYEHNLKASADGVLSALEVEEMVAARRIELQEEIGRNEENLNNKARQTLITRLALELDIADSREKWHHIRIAQIEQEVEAHRAAGVDIVLLEKWRTEQIKNLHKEVPESLRNMADIMLDQQDRIRDSMGHLLEDGIFRVITGADDMKTAWQRALEAMRDITGRIISHIISELLQLYVAQQIIGVAAPTLGLTPTGAAPATSPAMPIIPSGGIRSVGSNIGTVVGGGESALIRAIDDLRHEIRQDKNPNFNLHIDGVEMRNAVVRASNNMNILGGSRV